MALSLAVIARLEEFEQSEHFPKTLQGIVIGSSSSANPGKFTFYTNRDLTGPEKTALDQSLTQFAQANDLTIRSSDYEQFNIGEVAPQKSGRGA